MSSTKQETAEIVRRIEKLESQMQFLFRSLGVSSGGAPGWTASPRIMELLRSGSRVEAIEIRDGETGAGEVIECDTVVFTGDWIPENELARRAEVKPLKPSLGPQVDAAFRTSRAGVFAAGNVLRGVETADWAALEGRAAAQSMARWLDQAQWPAIRLGIEVEAPIVGTLHGRPAEPPP